MEPSYTPPTTPPPGAPAPTPAGKPSSAKLKQMQLFLYIALGVLFIFFVLTLVFMTQAGTTHAKLEGKYASGLQDGKIAQQQTDIKKYQSENNTDLRVYTAPELYGAFQVSYPKVWSLTVNSSSSTPVSGLAHPDNVDLQADKYALRFSLVNTVYANSKKTYTDLTRNSKGKLKSSAVSVSGIEGVKYVGYKDQRQVTAGTYIILPLRDKTFVLQTDNNEVYGPAFDIVTAKLKLNP